MSRNTFMKELLEGSHFEVVDSVGLMHLGGNRTVKLELFAPRNPGEYTGVLVRIIHIHRGELDAQVFTFSDTMKCDAPVTVSGAFPYVWAPEGWEWYKFPPDKESRKEFLEVITEYLNYFYDGEVQPGKTHPVNMQRLVREL